MALRKTGPRSDPEGRFLRLTRRGEPPTYRPELGRCLLYLGPDNGNGYGQFYYDGRNGYIHRYAWERANGPIPDGLTVDHLCRVRRCAEVAHLELTGRVENYLRGVAARSGTCRNGLHHRTDENTRMLSNGKRVCLDCRRETWRRGYNKSREGKPDTRVRYDQQVVRGQIIEVRAARSTIAQSARIIGCNPNYLGRRIWKETRQAVLDRDERSCVRCGETASDVHHRLPRGSGGTNKPEISFGMSNLISLCRVCHSWVEQHRELSYELGFLVRRTVSDVAAVPVLLANGWVLLTKEGTTQPCTPGTDASSPPRS